MKGVAGAPDSYKTGGVVRRTGLAMVHKGEVVIPNGVQQKPPTLEASGIMRDLPLPAKVVPDADALARKGYTGDNAPWRK